MIKKAVKTLLLWMSFIFKRNKDSKVIYYHDIGVNYTEMGTPISIFEEHIKAALKSGYTIVKEISSPCNQIMVCFDDGWAGIYDYKDRLIDKGIFPTVFLAVELIGTPGYLSLPQVIELQNQGFVFECHSWSHMDLTTYDEQALDHQISDSKEHLSLLLGKDVRSICFPLGRFSDLIIDKCYKAGYTKLFSSIPGGYFDLPVGKKVICRNLVQHSSTREFVFIINSRSNALFKRAVLRHYKKD